MRQVSARKRAMVRKGRQVFPVQQPVPPIGGFGGVNRNGYSRGMPRQAAMLKGDLPPNPKIRIPRPFKARGRGRGVMSGSDNAAGRPLAGRGLGGVGRRQLGTR